MIEEHIEQGFYGDDVRNHAAAFDSYLLATHGKYLQGGDGIVAHDIEETLEHIGRLAHRMACAPPMR